jgi:hypothetical protein
VLISAAFTSYLDYGDTSLTYKARDAAMMPYDLLCVSCHGVIGRPSTGSLNLEIDLAAGRLVPHQKLASVKAE